MSQTAPTLVSYTEVASWVAGAASKSVTVSWNAGDILVVICGTEGSTSALPGVPTATGLTFSSVVSNNVASTCATRLSIATAAGSGSSVSISVSNSDTTEHWGFGVWVFRSSDGQGNSAEQHTATHSVAATPAGGADSAFVWGVFDFAAGTLGTLTPTPSNTRQRVVDSTHYTIYVADLTDQTSAGSVSYGLTGTGGGPFSIVVCEIKGTAVSAGVLYTRLERGVRGMTRGVVTGIARMVRTRFRGRDYVKGAEGLWLPQPIN